MSTWYEQAIFYHMYPLGMTGAPKQNAQTEVTDRFKELDQWIPHIRSLGCNAIYIGPLFESSSHGYDTRDYKLVDRRLGTNDDFRSDKIICASGIPIRSIACAAAVATTSACGSAIPTSSAAQIMILREINLISSPAYSIFAR